MIDHTDRAHNLVRQVAARLRQLAVDLVDLARQLEWATLPAAPQPPPAMSTAVDKPERIGKSSHLARHDVEVEEGRVSVAELRQRIAEARAARAAAGPPPPHHGTRTTAERVAMAEASAP